MKLFNNFFTLQMDIRRAKQAVEKKDEQLDASRRILEAQEDELFVSGHIPALSKMYWQPAIWWCEM